MSKLAYTNLSKDSSIATRPIKRLPEIETLHILKSLAILIISKVSINICTANEYHNNSCTKISPSQQLRKTEKNTGIKHCHGQPSFEQAER
jgi:hypothetical protein